LAARQPLDGLQLLDAMKARIPNCHRDDFGARHIETAGAAIKQAPTTSSKSRSRPPAGLGHSRALETSRLSASKALKQLARRRWCGKSSSMNQLRQTIEKISPTNSRILIVGPAGAGKELTARAIHGQSARANGPFIVINAAAMMPERMEVELFASSSRRTGEDARSALSRRHMADAVH